MIHMRKFQKQHVAEPDKVPVGQRSNRHWELFWRRSKTEPLATGRICEGRTDSSENATASLPVLKEVPVAVGRETHALAKLTHFQRFANWLKQHKTSVLKLNASYLIGTVLGAFSALGGAYVAQELGLSETQASTWVAGVCHFSGAMVGVCTSWVIFQKDKYLKHPKQIFVDAVKIIANSLKAQSVSWIFTWAATYGMLAIKIPWELAVILQTQVLDRIVYIPLFNYFNRKRVEETSDTNTAG